MATYGKLTAFDPDLEDWELYVERLGHYFKANAITEPEKKSSILLSVCGPKTYKLIRNLLAPVKPGAQTFEELTNLVKNHQNPTPSKRVQRFKFNSRTRNTDETIATFVAELRQLSEHCQYGDTLEDMLCDRLVCGVHDDRIQRRLLAEPSLDFAKAMKIAVAMETAAKNAKDLKLPASAGANGVTVQKIQKQTGPLLPRKGRKPQKHATMKSATPAGKCYRCGRSNHAATDCHFKDATCNHCGKKGHIAPVCKSKTKPTQHHLQIEDEREQEYAMHTMRHRTTDPWLVQVQVDNHDLTMEIDTGASVSIISEEAYHKTWPAADAPILQKTSVKLRMYTGTQIVVLGVIKVKLHYQSQRVDVPLLVVRGKGPNLLGRDILRHIRLDWAEIHQLKADSHKAILEKYPQVFKDELGTLRGHTAKICVDSRAIPVFCKPRVVPYALREQVEEELERLQRDGVIEPVQFSQWAAPIVPVPKPNGAIRICGDYKITVNKASTLDKYPIPKIDDLFATLAGGKTFTKLDMSHAYQQLLLDEESKQYVTINTHKGLFQYNRLPFGVSSAPAIFQRTMDSLLQGIPHVAVYLDDILITGKTNDEHLKNLDEVLRRFDQAGLRLKCEKCVFQSPEVVYLGHKVDAKGLHPTEDKLQAIKHAPAPLNIAELRSYLGLLNYYGKFLPNLSTTLAPLHVLLRKETRWHWGVNQEKAFQASKKLLEMPTVLVHFDITKDIILACDASPYGVGAVLSHRMADGSEKPIGFASRSLSQAETRYSQLDKEALAIVFGVKKFHQYLYGRHFTICTDHKPLLGLFNESRSVPHMASGRVQRWALILAAYEYTIVYKPGQANANADAFSRLPLPDKPKVTPIPMETALLMEQLESSPVNVNQIKNWTRKDPLLSRILRYAMQGWPETSKDDDELKPFHTRKTEISIQDGCLLWGTRVIVPPQGRVKIMDELHDGHPGISRMKSIARGFVWWPKMDLDLADRVQKCKMCQQTRRTPPEAPLHPWEWPATPWSRIHMDYAGPFMGKMFLVIIDAHSKWMDVHPMSSSTANATIEKLRVTFATLGLPETVVTDNGSAFTSAEFQEFMHQNGVKHIRTAPYHPASNGLAERAVQTFKSAVKRMTSGTVETKVSRFLFKYRITPHSTTGISPAELIMGRPLRSHLALLQPDLGGRVKQKQAQQKQLHDRHATDRVFNIGDPVYVKNFSSGQIWLPGFISEKSGPVSYQINLGNRVVRRHVDHIRRRYDKDVIPDISQTVEPEVSIIPERNETVLDPTPITEPIITPTPTPNMDNTNDNSRPIRDRKLPSKFKDFVMT